MRARDRCCCPVFWVLHLIFSALLIRLAVMHVPRRIHFSPYFFSIGWVFWVTMSLTRTVSSRREHVTTNAGGSNLLMCAGGHLRAKYEVSPSSLLTSWRYLILGSAFYRNLCLFCRYCTPIVYMPETMPHVSPIVPGGSC